MKKLFTILICLFSLGQAQAQCTPQGDFSNIEYGAIPDTIQNFQPALINSLYTQQIDVKVPSNGDFAGLSFLTVDSAQLIQIINLPPGLSYECNSPLTSFCTFPGGSVGCGIISGIPTELGTFELEVMLLVYTNLFPDPLPFVFEGYRIIVNTVISTPEVQSDFNYIRLKPNPANEQTVLSTYVNQQGKAELRIFDRSFISGR